MTTGILIWLIVFAIAALLFFGIAAIIAVLGMQDLKLLLSKSEKLDLPKHGVKNQRDDQTS
jgi:hypothetical protein